MNKEKKNIIKKQKEIQKSQDDVQEFYKKQVEELERLIRAYHQKKQNNYLLNDIEKEIKHEAAIMIKDIESKAKEEADRKAKEIISLCNSKMCS